MEIPTSSMPRERLVERGVHALSDQELLAILCKRPITRCIASLQSSSYTVFKQKIGEDFL